MKLEKILNFDNKMLSGTSANMDITEAARKLIPYLTSKINWEIEESLKTSVLLELVQKIFRPISSSVILKRRYKSLIPKKIDTTDGIKCE